MAMILRWTVVLSLAAGLAAPALGDGLPSAPAWIGKPSRDAQGKLTGIPDRSPAKSPETSATGTPSSKPAPAATVLPATTAPQARAEAPSVTAGQAAPIRTATCAPQAITCVEVHKTDALPGWTPVTFGQPFKPGDVPPSTTLVGRDDKGNQVPLQFDGRATHPDGSLRFAVVSAELAQMKPGESRTLDIVRTNLPAPPVPKTEGAFQAPNDLRIVLSLFSRQVTAVKFGDRQGQTPGTPFQAGETIELAVGAPPEEHFTLTVTPEMSSGDFTAYMKIAKAFVSIINAQSKNFRAYWLEPNDSYDLLHITTTKSIETFPVSVNYRGAAKYSTRVEQELEPRANWVAKLDDRVSGKAWLDGPVATERDILLPLVPESGGAAHPHLTARLHLRRYHASAAVRADVIIENTTTFEPAPRNYTYDIAVTGKGKDVFRNSEIRLYHHARWHHAAWLEGWSEPELFHNIRYLLDSRAIPHYDPTLKVAAQAIEHDAQALSKADTTAGGTALVTIYMPTTGGRADIGPLPRWTVQYLLTQAPQERAVVFANAEAGTSIPVHYRDEETDLPVLITDYPEISLDGRVSHLPKPVNDATPWTAQIAHHPSLFYVPYLLTGDKFWAEEMAYWANWVELDAIPAYRNGKQGLITPNEIRGQAWSLRTLGESAAVLPDASPLKTYFNHIMKNNLNWYIEHYVHAAPGADFSPLGIIPKPDQPDIMAPWQQDYLMMVLAHLAEQGFPGSEELLKWLGKFSVGRWVKEAEGYCRQMGPAYYIKIRDDNKQYLPSWRDLFRKNWPEATACPSAFVGDVTSSGGYGANAYGMLGGAVDFGIEGAAQALAQLRKDAPNMLEAMRFDPTFAIVPRREK